MGYRASFAARGVRPIVLALLAALALLLTACARGSGSAAHTPTATPTGGGTQTPAATPQTISTSVAPVGIAGLCSLAPSVSAQLPGDIPPYPSAQLRIGSNQNGSGIFGYCSTASVTDVDSFYVGKIPENGWQHESSSTIGGTDQIQATKGSTALTITILTDGQVSGDTDIIIVLSASG